MKTRKYKDNQQRKNFAQNESKILLMQYFKKKASNVQPSYANSKEMQPLGQIPSVSDYKKWASFKYPKSLSAFFLERPSLKSTYLLINLKDHVSELEGKAFRSGGKTTQLENTYNRIPNLKKEQALDLIQIAIKDLSFKVCYSKKTKQQQNKTRIRGRCIQSNRPRSVSRLLRLSRIRIRTLALEGKIPGCTRST